MNHLINQYLGGIDWETVMLPWWTKLHGLMSTWAHEYWITQHSPPLHQEMHAKYEIVWHGLFVCEGTIDVEAYVGILERHMLPSRQQIFPGTPCLFLQDNSRPHYAQVKAVWLRRHRVHVLDWPACSLDLSPIENVCRIMKTIIGQRRPRTVEQFKSCIHQELAKIPQLKLQQLISSVPKSKCN